MNGKLCAYIDALFASVPQTTTVRELKEEMLQNLTDKYNDLIAEGKTEEEAYKIAVSSIGDVSALIGGTVGAAAARPAVEKAAGRPRNGLITAIAVVLYVLCCIPFLLLSEDVLATLLMFDLIAAATGLLIADSPRHTRAGAGVIAVAVMLYILCVTACVALQNVFGVLVMFLMIAAATGLLVYNGSKTVGPVSGGGAGNVFAADAAAPSDNARCWVARIGAGLVLALMVVLLILAGARSGRAHDRLHDYDRGGRWEAAIPMVTPIQNDLALQDGRNAQQADAAAQEVTAVPIDSTHQGQQDRKGERRASSVLAGGASVPVTDLSEIEVDWVSGTVHVAVGGGGDITFAETSARELTEKQRLRYRVHDGKLSISYCAATWTIWDWLDIDRLNMPRKDLTVTIPASFVGQFKELEINGVSADVIAVGAYARETSFMTISGSIQASGVMGEELSAESTSGRIELSGCTVRALDVETVAGNAEVSAAAEDVDMQTVSGTLRVALANAPYKLETESVSGDITIMLPRGAGNFTAKVDTVSGGFTCDIPTVLENGRYIAGTGAAEYRFESVGGDIRIVTN